MNSKKIALYVLTLSIIAILIFPFGQRTSSPEKEIVVFDQVPRDIHSIKNTILSSSDIPENHKDVFLLGNNTTIDSPLTNDLFSISDTLIINTLIQGDVYAGANSITFEEGFSSQEDIYLVGSDIYITGDIEGDIYAIGEHITLDNAEISGNIDITANTLSLTGETLLKGSTTLSVQEENVTREETVFIKEIIFDTLEKPSIKNYVYYAFFDFIKYFILGLIVYFLFPIFSNSISNTAKKSPKHTLLTIVISALAFCITIGTAIGLLFIPVVGSVLEAVIAIIIVSCALALIGISIFTLGATMNVIGSLVGKSMHRKCDVLDTVALGAIIFTLLAHIPFIGDIIKTCILLYVFGATLFVLYSSYRKNQE